MKQKVLVLALAAALAASLGGCGSETESAANQESSTEAETVSIDSEADHEIATKREVLTEADQMFYEDDLVRLTYTGVVETFNGQNLELTVENLTDQKIGIWAQYVAVNGVMLDDSMSIDLEAGETQEYEHLMIGLTDRGIDEMGTITLRLVIQDAETNEVMETVDDVTFAANEGVEDLTSTETGELVYDENNIRIFYLSQDGNETGTRYLFRLENQNNVVAKVNAKEVYLDGVYYEGAYMVSEILPGTISYDKVCGVDLSYPNDVETMEVVFKIEDADNSADCLETEKISIPIA